MQRDRLNLAMIRMRRRASLWRAARAACPTYDSFRQSCPAIELAIAATLAREGL